MKNFNLNMTSADAEVLLPLLIERLDRMIESGSLSSLGSAESRKEARILRAIISRVRDGQHDIA